MKMKIETILETYKELSEEINYINLRLVELLNELEEEFNFSPFESDNEELVKIWNLISKARNTQIYKLD